MYNVIVQFASMSGRSRVNRATNLTKEEAEKMVKTLSSWECVERVFYVRQ